jgi:Integrase zinc binding domain
LITIYSNKALEFSIINRLLHQKGKLYISHSTPQADILQEFHDSTSVGHPEIAKITHAIKQLYWWSEMKQIIKHYIKECDICQ